MVYNERKKVTSSAKKKRKQGGMSLHQVTSPSLEKRPILILDFTLTMDL